MSASDYMWSTTNKNSNNGRKNTRKSMQSSSNMMQNSIASRTRSIGEAELDTSKNSTMALRKNQSNGSKSMYNSTPKSNFNRTFNRTLNSPRKSMQKSMKKSWANSGRKPRNNTIGGQDKEQDNDDYNDNEDQAQLLRDIVAAENSDRSYIVDNRNNNYDDDNKEVQKEEDEEVAIEEEQESEEDNDNDNQQKQNTIVKVNRTIINKNNNTKNNGNNKVQASHSRTHYIETQEPQTFWGDVKRSSRMAGRFLRRSGHKLKQILGVSTDAMKSIYYETMDEYDGNQEPENPDEWTSTDSEDGDRFERRCIFISKKGLKAARERSESRRSKRQTM